MLTDALKGQLDKAFSILDAAIPSFSEEAWHKGSPPFNGPARAVTHVLQCAEFYISEDKEIFVNLGKKVWQMSDEETPSQPQMLEYLQRVREMTSAWLDTMGDNGLRQSCQSEYAANGMERVAYALRHLQHHIGEVCAYQKQNGLEPAEWK